MSLPQTPAAPETPPPGPLLVTSESFEQLEAEWAALHAACPDATPFTHPAWHATWLRHFGAGVEPVYLSFRRGEELVGTAALEITGDTARALGDHNVRDYAGPLAAPGEEARVASALLEWLREDLTPKAELWGIAAGAPMHAALEEAAADNGWLFEVAHEAVCPAIDVSGGFEAYVAGLPKHERHELRRKMRNLAAAGDVRFESETGAAVGQQIDRLLHLMRASRADKDEFLTPTMEAFFRDLAGTFGELGLARLGTLWLDGQDAAAVFTFENHRTVYLYNSGYDPAHARLAVGLVSKAHAIDEAAARGKTTFDFLRGDEEYKRRLGGTPQEVVTLRLQSR
ncbi:MAG: GNAT family N-acetyltransferase [Dehalococcoidia bacterium]|nr:GNAT family N-acetyltransferase [Dehalococcoidia bacterium]